MQQPAPRLYLSASVRMSWSPSRLGLQIERFLQVSPTSPDRQTDYPYHVRLQVQGYFPITHHHIPQRCLQYDSILNGLYWVYCRH